MALTPEITPTDDKNLITSYFIDHILDALSANLGYTPQGFVDIKKLRTAKGDIHLPSLYALAREKLAEEHFSSIRDFRFVLKAFTRKSVVHGVYQFFAGQPSKQLLIAINKDEIFPLLLNIAERFGGIFDTDFHLILHALLYKKYPQAKARSRALVLVLDEIISTLIQIRVIMRTPLADFHFAPDVVAYALCCGLPLTARALIKLGADIDSACHFNVAEDLASITPLAYAFMNLDLALIETLISLGVRASLDYCMFSGASMIPNPDACIRNAEVCAYATGRADLLEVIRSLLQSFGIEETELRSLPMRPSLLTVPSFALHSQTALTFMPPDTTLLLDEHFYGKPV